MWRKTLSTGFVVLVLAGCGESDTAVAPVEYGPGAETAVAAVTEVVDLLQTPDFETAGHLAVPDQAALASLAEGATFGQVASALTKGDVDVAANFWAGFAQGYGAFLAESSTISDGDLVVVDNVEFSGVTIALDDGSDRQVFARDLDGFRIDLFASFGPGVAGRMIQPVERLLSSQTDDARVILPALKEIVPSLRVAVSQPDLPPQTSQDLLRLLELITRIS